MGTHSLETSRSDVPSCTNVAAVSFFAAALAVAVAWALTDSADSLPRVCGCWDVGSLCPTPVSCMLQTECSLNLGERLCHASSRYHAKRRDAGSRHAKIEPRNERARPPTADGVSWQQ